MARDRGHLELPYQENQIEHCYGPNVHLSSSPYLQSLMAAFSSPETKLPHLNYYIQRMYQGLLTQVVNTIFPRKVESVVTRMKEFTEHGEFDADLIDRNVRAVTVGLARAGTYPSHVCTEELAYLVGADNLRQDHFYMNRKTNEKGEVVGVDVSGSKIGGDLDNAIVLLPDPMAATGSSLSYTISHYKEKVSGTPYKFVAMHLIVTPEYLKRMKKDHPDVAVFAVRLDRGLSSRDILDAVPGKLWDQERGLTDNHYIVPGAGGVGEILNNSFV